MAQRNKVRCIECGNGIDFEGDIGDMITCEHCYGDFEIISINPPKIKTLSGEGDIDEEYDDKDMDWDD